MRKRMVSAALVLVTVLPIGAVLFPVTSCSGRNACLGGVDKEEQADCCLPNDCWTAIENAANANNKGAVKADLIKLSNESVVFASIADSPSNN